MLQIELRINGCLIDCVDIVNTCVVAQVRDASQDDIDLIYDVTQTRGGKTARVIHTRKDGALKLAALALNALTKTQRKPRGKRNR